MEEIILSGYCRYLDQNRIVTVEFDEEKWYCDCSFGNCPHEGSCNIAEKLKTLDIQ